MKARIPWVTIAVVAGALLVAASVPFQLLLNYDREKIMAGEAWRMFTGHWLHMSARHLAYNVTAFAVIGTIIETKGIPGFGNLFFLSPWIISAASIVFAPGMTLYFGLSSLALAAWTFLATQSLTEGGVSRAIGIAMLTLAIAKLGFESSTGNALFVPVTDPWLRVAVVSHIAGAVIGALFAILPSCVSESRRAKQVRSESPDYSRQV